MMANLLFFATSALFMLPVACGIRFYVQPTVFYDYDKNINLICANFTHSTSKLQNISRILIERLKSDDQWRIVAEAMISKGITVHSFNPDFRVDGYLGDMTPDYLTITWFTASPDKFGKYRCRAAGVTNTGLAVIKVSPVIDIRSIPDNSRQMFDFIARSERGVLRNFEDILLKMLQVQMQDSRSLMKAQRHKYFLSASSDLTAKLDKIRNAITNYVPFNDDTSMWPEGDFALLMPDSYCPLNPPEWRTGYVKQRGIVNNNLPVFPGERTALPSFEDRLYIYQQFCSLENSTKRTQSWPKGSYCINTRNASSCPNGFTRSELKYDLDDSFRSPSYGALPDGNYDERDFHTISYCCRNDGTATKPISLPWSKPFYLYRHGKECQQVINMMVTDDIFTLSTSTDSGGDAWLDTNSKFRPEITIKPIKASLCYYVRSN